MDTPSLTRFTEIENIYAYSKDFTNIVKRLIKQLHNFIIGCNLYRFIYSTNSPNF